MYAIKLDGISELLSADVLLVPPNSLSALKFQQNEIPESISRFQAHGIIVLDCSIISVQCELSTPHNVLDEDEISDRRSLDSGILVFPPPGTSSSTIHGPVNVLINGDSTLSCPPGRSENSFESMISMRRFLSIVSISHSLSDYEYAR